MALEKPMTQTLTRQEIFDTAYRGLEAQGFKQSLNGSGCSYRGDDGRKCAIGHIIPDERYNSDMEGIAADNLADKCLNDLIAISDYDFIWRLQRCHDGSYEPKAMQECLRELADGYDLTVPVEVQS